MPADELPFPDCEPFSVSDEDTLQIPRKISTRKRGQTTKGMETAARKNKPGLRRDHAEGFRSLLSRLAAIPGPRSDAETKALSFLTACAEYLEQDETRDRLARKQEEILACKRLAGTITGVGSGRPKKVKD